MPSTCYSSGPCLLATLKILCWMSLIRIYLKLFITIQPLRVMTGPYFQSLREITENFSHYAK